MQPDIKGGNNQSKSIQIGNRNCFAAQHPCPLCSPKCPICHCDNISYKPVQNLPDPTCKCKPRATQSHTKEVKSSRICTPHGEEPPPCCYSWLTNITEQFRVKNALTQREKQDIQDLYATPCSSKDDACVCRRTYHQRLNYQNPTCTTFHKERISNSSSECMCNKERCREERTRRFFLAKRTKGCKACKRQREKHAPIQSDSDCQQIDIPVDYKGKTIKSITIQLESLEERKCNCSKVFLERPVRASQKCDCMLDKETKTGKIQENKTEKLNSKQINTATATDDFIHKNEDIFVTLKQLLTSCLQQQTTSTKFQELIEKILNSDKCMDLNEDSAKACSPPNIQSSYLESKPLWSNLFQKTPKEEITTRSKRNTTLKKSISKIWRRKKSTNLELKWYATGAELKRICGLLNSIVSNFESPSNINLIDQKPFNFKKSTKATSSDYYGQPLEDFCNKDVSMVVNSNSNSLFVNNSEQSVASTVLNNSINVNNQEVDSDSLATFLNEPINTNLQNVKFPKLFDLLANTERTNPINLIQQMEKDNKNQFAENNK